MDKVAIIGTSKPITDKYIEGIVQDVREVFPSYKKDDVLVCNDIYESLREARNSRKDEVVKDLLTSSMHELVSRGAKYGLIPHCTLCGKYAEHISKETGVKVITQTASVIKALKERDINEIVVFGTFDSVLQARKELSANEINGIEPRAGELCLMNDIIYDQLASGIICERSMHMLAGLAYTYRRSGLPIGLFCTDLIKLINPSNFHMAKKPFLFDAATCNWMHAASLITSSATEEELETLEINNDVLVKRLEQPEIRKLA